MARSEISETEAVRETARRDDARRDDMARSLAPMSAMLTGRRWRHAARWIGLLIFFGGAGLVGFVFLKALEGFSNFSQANYLQSQINRVAGDTWQALTVAALSVIGGQLFRLLYLLLLGYLGSLLAAKGIQLFSASESVIDEAVVGGIEE